MSSQDMSQYLGIFLDEGREQLAALETNILAMERGDHSVEILQTIFRAAHTLKGSSRAMGFMAVGDLTHEMENVLDDLRHGNLEVTTPIIDALLDCLDALNVLVDSIAQTSSDGNSQGRDIPALVSHLNTLRSGGAPDSAGQNVEAAAAVAATANANEAVAIPVSAYEQASIDDARAAGNEILHIRIVLHPDCLMKSVRAFMVFGALEPLGSVIVAQPNEDKLEAEEFDRTFELLVATDKPMSETEEALGRISEIETVAVASWTGDSSKQDAKPAAKAAAKAGKAPKLSAKTPSAEPSVVDQAATSEPAKPAGGSAASHNQTIRVDVARLDSLLNLVGELVIERTQITRLGLELRSHYPQDETTAHLIEATHRIARISAELQEEIMKTRMLPIDGVFQRMPRMVRDLAQKTGKTIDFKMWGGETELDRSVLEVLGDPLIHLLRNCVDHGIEAPEDRRSVGKSATGMVAMSARHEENHIVIEISDDGGGIDPEKIKAAAVRKEIIAQSTADTMGDRDALNLIFASGFSTASVISDISGRGVGMDIVKSNLERLGGRINVVSQVGVGSTFTIHLPLTLAIVRALLVLSGGGTYVLPLGSVIEMLQLGTEEGEVPRHGVGGQGTIVLRGRTVPLISLSDLLLGDTDATRLDRIGENAYVVIVGSAERQVGLCVDGLLGEQEVVIKSLSTLLGDIRGLSGATILGDGRVALIVDPAKAMECVREISERQLVA